MRALIQAGEDGCAAGGANGRGQEHVLETHALGGQPVDIRRLEYRMDRAPEPIPAMVVE